MKAYIMGNYTEKAFQGFLKDPTSDRKAVVEQLTKAMGGTMHSMDIVRGSYDFVVVTCLLYTSPSPRDATLSRMPSSA